MEKLPGYFFKLSLSPKLTKEYNILTWECPQTFPGLAARGLTVSIPYSRHCVLISHLLLQESCVIPWRYAFFLSPSVFKSLLAAIFESVNVRDMRRQASSPHILMAISSPTPTKPHCPSSGLGLARWDRISSLWTQAMAKEEQWLMENFQMNKMTFRCSCVFSAHHLCQVFFSEHLFLIRTQSCFLSPEWPQCRKLHTDLCVVTTRTYVV